MYDPVSNFIWLADNWVPWVPDEDVTLVHEIGHLLGLDHTPFGIMANVQYNPDPMIYELTDAQVDEILGSPLLTPIPDPLATGPGT